MKDFVIIAGPCAVESKEQVFSIYEEIKDSIDYFRAGAYKPRTNPYSFQGLREEGLAILKELKEEKNIPVVSEVTTIEDIEKFKDIDILQVGARNMHNYELLKALGRTNKTILLKRGLAATIEEFINASEYIIKEGNKNVILCERGIRTFETMTRNTLDLSSVVAIKKMTNLKVYVDPSHAAGRYDFIYDLALASVACGADGIMIEVHNEPDKALSDGKQSILPEKFNKLAKDLRKLKTFIDVLKAE